MQIAQTAFTIFYVRFDDISAVSHASMSFVAFNHFQAHKVRRSICNHFVPEPQRRFFVHPSVAPDEPALQQGCTDGQILLRHFHGLIQGSAGLAYFQAKVPKKVKDGFHHLFSPRASLVRRYKRNIDVAMRSHLASAVSANGQNRDPF